MPQHKTHLFVGFLTYAALLYLALFIAPFSFERKIELLMYALIGSLFPDIDTKSKIQRIMYSMLFVLFLLLMHTRQYGVAAILGPLMCLPLMVHHRGIFHSPLFLAGLSATAVCLTAVYFPAYTHKMVFNCLFFLGGALSHLWADKRL